MFPIEPSHVVSSCGFGGGGAPGDGGKRLGHCAGGIFERSSAGEIDFGIMRVLTQMVVALIGLYRRWVSPLLTVMFSPSGLCRFTPSCSEFAMEAVTVHGVVRGGAMSARRICRCHPLGGCGHDPVPRMGRGVMERPQV